MSQIRLGYRYDKRLKSWWLLLITLILSLCLVQTLALINARIHLASQDFAERLLGADIVVNSSTPLSPDWITHAREQGLHVAQTLNFLSMVQLSQHWRLISVTAISPTYPLKGTFRLQGRAVYGAMLASGHCWLGAGWQGIALADNDLRVGALTSRIAGQVEQTSAGNMDAVISLGPRLYIPLSDVPRTEIVQPGSKVTYQLLLAGDTTSLKQYVAWLKPQLSPQQQLMRADSSIGLIQRPWLMLMNFLNGTAIITILLAAITLVLVSYHYAQMKAPMLALFKVLGVKRRTLQTSLVISQFKLWLISAILTPPIALALQWPLLHLLGISLPSLSIDTYVKAFLPVWGLGLLLISFMILPMLWPLTHINPIRIWRNENNLMSAWCMPGLLLGLMLITLWQTRDLDLAVQLLSGFILIALALAGLVWLLLQLAERALNWLPVNLRLPLRLLCRRPLLTLMQVTVLTLSLISLGFVFIAKGNLLTDWQQSLPTHTANTFLLNILPAQVKPLSDKLQHLGFGKVQSYPQVRARLVAKNQHGFTPQEAQDNALKRDLNLSWVQTLPPNNQIVHGVWWTSPTNPIAQVSIEQGLADRLHIKLDDTLSFQTNSQVFTATVTSIRSLEWQSFQPNFFFIFPPGFIHDEPVTYLSSIHVAIRDKTKLAVLMRQFPNLTVIDVRELIFQLQQFTHQAAKALGFVLIFAWLLAFLLLWQLTQLYQAWSRQWLYLLNVLGITRTKRYALILIEFSLLAGLALILSIGILTGAAALIKHWLINP